MQSPSTPRNNTRWKKIRTESSMEAIMLSFYESSSLWIQEIFKGSLWPVAQKRVPVLRSLRVKMDYAGSKPAAFNAPIGHAPNAFDARVFPAFCGFVGFEFDMRCDVLFERSRCTHSLANNGFHTEHGGWVREFEYNYFMVMYLQDFPNLQKEVEESLIVKRLSDEPMSHCCRIQLTKNSPDEPTVILPLS